MEKIAIILVIVGLVALVFSFWSLQLVRKHLRQFKNNYRHFSGLTDEKYFELKARQEFIVYASLVVIGILTFIGFSSITDIKAEMSKQVEAEKVKLDSLNTSETKAYVGLQARGSSYRDSVTQALQLVSSLKDRLSRLDSKDILQQNIYIVDPLSIGSFPKVKSDPNQLFRQVKFKDLVTISGQKLPQFKTPPSLICFSPTHASLLIQNVTVESFEIRPDSYFPVNKNDMGESVQFSLWISQKPSTGSFSSAFSKDFK